MRKQNEKQSHIPKPVFHSPDEEQEIYSALLKPNRLTLTCYPGNQLCQIISLYLQQGFVSIDCRNIYSQSRSL